MGRASMRNNLTWWRHQMETFSALLAICAGNSPVNSPHKGQWRGALMFSLICARINGWVNNRETGDLSRHRAHYDVIVMNTMNCSITIKNPMENNSIWNERATAWPYSVLGHKVLLTFLWMNRVVLDKRGHPLDLEKHFYTKGILSEIVLW